MRSVHVIGLLIARLAIAALPAATTWEVRPSVGNDNNGGGFVTGSSGTDFSQQNSAQYTFADLASSNGTTNPCVVSSASHNFVAADVGNLIHITAGTNWTTGFYEIVSVATNNATLDRACGSAASLSGGTYAVGGAVATLSSILGSLTASNTVYNKASATQTITSTLSMPSLASNPPLSIIGYNASRGDNGQATITTATNSVHLITVNNIRGLLLQNFIFTSTAGTPGDGIRTLTQSSAEIVVQNCSFSGFNIGIDADFQIFWDISGLSFINSEMKNSTSHGIDASGSTLVMGSYVHNNGGVGIRAGTGGGDTGPMIIVDTVVKSNSSHGIQSNTGTPRDLYLLNTASINNTGDGLNTSNSTLDLSIVIMNCIFDSNGGWGINFGVKPRGLWNQTNGYRANTSGANNNLSSGPGDVTLTADPFTNRGANDFSLNNTAGGGAALRGVGFPGVMQVGGTGFLAIGPLQPAGSGGQKGFPIVQ